ncbi:hypothetical protein AB0H88_22885 [Nonomuraea sp. NPDC050680]|uniref:hypothetical protein n=1 Tax=unclassified Nonomuraea TaxID=2593643 RepID=UPI0033CCDBCA
MRAHLAFTITVLSALVLLTACQQEKPPVNKTPLPSVAAAPYICDYIPLDAVRLMTGVENPLVKGDFDLTAGKDWGSGGCFVYLPTGDKLKALDITLSPDGSKEEVDFEISHGAKRLPDIIPGAVGYYGQGGSTNNAQAAAVLVRGYDNLSIELVRGVKGRDNTADVVALMKLVAPKLILTTTPSPKKTTD